MHFPFDEGVAGAPAKRVVAQPTEGATLAPVIAFTHAIETYRTTTQFKW